MTQDSSAPLATDSVALTVRDLERVGQFYRDVIGLEIVEAGENALRLGVGTRILVTLERNPDARIGSPREAGLFHTAFLLPSRADLGRWAHFVMRSHVAIQGTADHGVSEAVYLADPEGNGVEIYADRARASWSWSDGAVVMSNKALDVDDLVREGGESPWAGAPAGTIVGHVHLQVGALSPAEAFYAGVLGFDVTCRRPGANFLSTGRYHHHLATNVWNSRNASVRAEPATGLNEVGLVARDGAVLGAIADRAAAAGLAATTIPLGLAVNDPWGIRIAIRTAAARADPS